MPVTPLKLELLAPMQITHMIKIINKTMSDAIMNPNPQFGRQM